MKTINTNTYQNSELNLSDLIDINGSPMSTTTIHRSAAHNYNRLIICLFLTVTSELLRIRSTTQLICAEWNSVPVVGVCLSSAIVSIPWNSPLSLNFVLFYSKCCFERIEREKKKVIGTNKQKRIFWRSVHRQPQLPSDFSRLLCTWYI